MSDTSIPAIEDLPYDPQYEGHADWLTDIEKVRAFKDEAMRRAVYEIQAALMLKRFAKPTHPQPPKKDWTQTPDRTCVDPVGEQQDFEKRYP